MFVAVMLNERNPCSTKLKRTVHFGNNGAFASDCVASNVRSQWKKYVATEVMQKV